MLLGVIALPVIFFVPGYLAIRSLLRKEKKPLDWLEAAFLSLLLSILLAGIIGLLLADFGHFSLLLLVIILAIYSLLIILLFKPFRFRLPVLPLNKEGKGTVLFLLAILLLAGFLFFQPSEYIVGGWDPGVYVNSGVNIARSGSLIIKDRLLKTIDPEEQMLFYHMRNNLLQKYGGFQVVDPQNGRIATIFYHLYPIWIAIFYTLFGIKGALLTNAFFGLLAIASIYLFTKKIFGLKVGILSIFLLTINIAQIWQVRFPTAEILTQFFIFSGLYAFRWENRRGKLISALCFSQIFFTRPDSILFLPALFAFFYIRSFKKVDWTDLWFILPFIALLIGAFFQNSIFNCTYSLFTIIDFIGKKTFYTVLVTIFFFALLLRIFLRKVDFPLNSILDKRIRFIFILIIMSLSIYAYFLRPYLVESSDARNFKELGWFLFSLGLVLGVGGFCWFILKELNKKNVLFALIAFSATTFFLYNKMIHPSYMWALRRYVPVVIPAFTIFASFAVFRIMERLSRIGKPVGFACIFLLAFLPLLRGKHIIIHNDYPGMVDFCEKFSKECNDKGILICDDSWLATPLQYIYGKTTLQVSDQTIERCEKIEEIMERWIRQGRKIYYITHGSQIFTKELNFIPIYSQKLHSRVLERLRGYPKKIRSFEPEVKIFRVEEIKPGEDKNRSCFVDVDHQCFGLEKGFSKPKKGRKGIYRWTGAEAEMIIPWSGDKVNQKLTLRMTLGQKGDFTAKVSIFVDNQFVGTIPISGGFKNYEIFIPQGMVSTSILRRAVLKITPEAGLDRGIAIDWVKVEKDLEGDSS